MDSKDLKVPRRGQTESFSTYAFRVLATIALGYLSYQHLFPQKPVEEVSTSSQVSELRAEVGILTIKLDNLNTNFIDHKKDTEKDMDELKSMIRYSYKTNHRNSRDNDELSAR